MLPAVTEMEGVVVVTKLQGCEGAEVGINVSSLIGLWLPLHLDALRKTTTPEYLSKCPQEWE